MNQDMNQEQKTCREVEERCLKCNDLYESNTKKYILTPLGYIDSQTKTFISTSQWCLKCCIGLERTIAGGRKKVRS